MFIAGKGKGKVRLLNGTSRNIKQILWVPVPYLYATLPIDVVSYVTGSFLESVTESDLINRTFGKTICLPYIISQRS